ncbi:hypothetical protein D3C87_1667320 [compost metagenome]
MPLEPRGTSLLQRRDASAIGRNRAEQLHHESLQRREGPRLAVVVIAFHGLLEPRLRIRVARVARQLQHDVVERISPLTESDEIMEALEHHILVAEVLALFSVLHPIPGKGLFGIRDLAR